MIRCSREMRRLKENMRPAQHTDDTTPQSDLELRLHRFGQFLDFPPHVVPRL